MTFIELADPAGNDIEIEYEVVSEFDPGGNVRAYVHVLSDLPPGMDRTQTAEEIEERLAWEVRERGLNARDGWGWR